MVGFSRYIVFLHCSTNNCASTVLDLFMMATYECGIPSRVRSDRGGENVLVCAYMVATRGTLRGSHIAGSSHHNQRIERLWRDVFRCVDLPFMASFTSWRTTTFLIHAMEQIYSCYIVCTYNA